MNASCLLDACRAAGLSLEAEGQDLFVEADRDPPAALLDELKLHKAEIVALLREPVAAGLQEGDLAQAKDTGRSPADWRDLYDERSAIRQYYGHYSRAEAEALAWGEMQNRWHAEHGERVSRDLCAGCRRPIRTEKVLDLIDGNRVHTSDDNACLAQQGSRWRAAATRALMAFGLRLPVGLDQ
jgi:hypothetical protein